MDPTPNSQNMQGELIFRSQSSEGGELKLTQGSHGKHAGLKQSNNNNVSVNIKITSQIQRTKDKYCLIEIGREGCR